MKKKIGILSLSLVTGVATAITTIIPLLAVEYPNQSLTRIETLVTVSSLSALLTIALNGKIVEKLGLKRTVLTGLLTGMIFGIAPFFLKGFEAFFLSRVFLGMGIGLYSPHAISLISMFFKGNERTTLLGVQMGISAFGNAILLFFSGWLAKFGWRYTFFVYIFLGIIFVLVLKYVPNITEEYNFEKRTNKKLSLQMKQYIFLCFITFTIIWGIQLKIPMYLAQKGLESSEKVGVLLGLMNIAGMLAGLTFGKFYQKIGIWLLPLGFFGAAFSVTGILLNSKWLLIVFFAVLFNFIYSFTGPTITLNINQLAEPSQITQVNSWISMTTILSAYAAPVIWNSWSKLFIKEPKASFSMMLMVISLSCIGGFLLLYLSLSKKNIDLKRRKLK